MFCTKPVRCLERRPFAVKLVTWTAGKAQLMSRATLLPFRRSDFARNQIKYNQINTKFANFAGLYFPHFTTLRNQTLLFY
jgi:hypothetical protein